MKKLYDYLGYTNDVSNPFETTFNAEYYINKGDYLDFDQAEFFRGVDYSVDDEFVGRESGKIFIPSQCRSDVTCKVHIAFNR